jgi:hypothetical protein
VVLLCYVINTVHWYVSLVYGGATALCDLYCTLVGVFVWWYDHAMCLTLYTSTCLVCALVQLPYLMDTVHWCVSTVHWYYSPIWLILKSDTCLWYRGATMLCDSYGHYTLVFAFSIVTPLWYVSDTVHWYASLVLWYYYGMWFILLSLQNNTVNFIGQGLVTWREILCDVSLTWGWQHCCLSLQGSWQSYNLYAFMRMYSISVRTLKFRKNQYKIAKLTMCKTQS